DPPRAFGGMGRAPGGGLLPGVADVDARLELARHQVAHGALGLARERDTVDWLAAVLAHQQVAERGGSGKAADVGGEDPALAALHGAPPVEGTLPSRRLLDSANPHSDRDTLGRCS